VPWLESQHARWLCLRVNILMRGSGWSAVVLM
jgi:hypothetical protein